MNDVQLFCRTARLVLAVCFFSLCYFLSPNCHAEIYEKHLKPSVQDGFDTTGLMILSTGALGVALLQAGDAGVREYWTDHHIISKEYSRIGDLLGTGIPSFLIMSMQYSSGHQAQARAHFESFLIANANTALLKYASHRHRPGGSADPYSMPSGHTTAAFASASSLASCYGWKVAIPSYLAATFVALSRLSDDAHWFTDTVAGATIGIFWGRATSLHEMGFIPIAYTHGGGLIWSKHF